MARTSLANMKKPGPPIHTWGCLVCETRVDQEATVCRCANEQAEPEQTEEAQDFDDISDFSRVQPVAETVEESSTDMLASLSLVVRLWKR